MNNDIRNDMTNILGEIFRNLALNERIRNDMTQEKMAETLFMDTRSYVYIEHGEHKCSALTAILLLIECEDRDDVLRDIEVKLKTCLQSSEEKELQHH